MVVDLRRRLEGHLLRPLLAPEFFQVDAYFRLVGFAFDDFGQFRQGGGVVGVERQRFHLLPVQGQLGAVDSFHPYHDGKADFVVGFFR